MGLRRYVESYLDHRRKLTLLLQPCSQYDILLMSETLSDDEVLRIYARVVLDFAESEDPVRPSGLRSPDLLASAVGRQHTGMGYQLKYPAPHQNAATLLYGICHDHPFVNGNKRTALVSMIAHLDKNRLTLVNVGKDELFRMILDVATHTFVARGSRTRPHHDPDEEVAEIAQWIKERLYRMQRGERQITYRQLRRVLTTHGFALENPNGNYIDVVKIKQVTERKLFSTKVSTVRQRIGNIAYPGENRIVGLTLLKHVRRICELTEADGFDSPAFYAPDDDENVIDGFIAEYRTVLRRLARR